MAEFNAPIPGQSLTKEPGKYAWERPPEIVDPEQVLQMHMIRLSDEDRMSAILDALEFGATDLYSLVKGMMRIGVSEGVHTIDAGMLAAPVVYEFLKTAADEAGIEYDDGLNIEQEKEMRQRSRQIFDTNKFLQQMKDEEPEQEVVMEEEPVMEEEEAPQKPRGLMAREGM